VVGASWRRGAFIAGPFGFRGVCRARLGGGDVAVELKGA